MSIDLSSRRKTKSEYRKFLKTPFWRNLSLRAKARAGFRCLDCGGKTSLECHHLRYPEDWFQTRLEDLVVLCRLCHKRRHLKTDRIRRVRKRRWERWKKESSQPLQ